MHIDFDDLRPRGSLSWQASLQEMLEDPGFQDFLAKYWRIKKPDVISRWIRRCNSISDFHQKIMVPAIRFIIQTTTQGLSTSGLQNLEPNRSYVFMSNHRDILLDSLLIGYALVQDGHQAPRMALGDNLLKMSWLGSLFHLNESVVVRRNLKPKELLGWSMRLSHYIHHSVKNGHNFWIAQKEGRAKDGIDQTNPGLIKMIGLHQKNLGGQAFAQLPIVPIAVSYEQDPCDVLKAKELFAEASSGKYLKKPGEDEHSMALGFAGAKGRVHIHFGKPIKMKSNQFREAIQAITNQVDQEIQANYRLWPTNFAAQKMLLRQELTAEEALAKVYLDERMAFCSAGEQSQFLAMYANPVRMKS